MGNNVRAYCYGSDIGLSVIDAVWLLAYIIWRKPGIEITVVALLGIMVLLAYADFALNRFE